MTPKQSIEAVAHKHNIPCVPSIPRLPPNTPPNTPSNNTPWQVFVDLSRLHNLANLLSATWGTNHRVLQMSVTGAIQRSSCLDGIGGPVRMVEEHEVMLLVGPVGW